MTIDTLEKEILALPVAEQIDLMDRIAIASAPAMVSGESSDSVKEALRREAEMEANPSIALTWEQIKSNLGRS